VKSRPGLYVVIAGSLLACLLTACSTHLAAGPFGPRGTPGAECAPVPRGGVLSFGFEGFRNQGGQVATISKITLNAPHRLRLIDAWVIPVTGDDLYGVLSGYPPVKRMQPGVQWAERQRASGATVEPGNGPPDHVSTNILAVLKPVHQTGWAQGLNVYYHVGDTQYVFHTATKIMVWTRGTKHHCG
jgi:hypothetical protein